MVVFSLYCFDHLCSVINNKRDLMSVIKRPDVVVLSLYIFDTIFGKPSLRLHLYYHIKSSLYYHIPGYLRDSKKCIPGLVCVCLCVCCVSGACDEFVCMCVRDCVGAYVRLSVCVRGRGYVRACVRLCLCVRVGGCVNVFAGDIFQHTDNYTHTGSGASAFLSTTSLSMICAYTAQAGIHTT